MTVIKKVCLVGANGSLGTQVLDELVKGSSFDVSVLVRANSTSEPAHAGSVTKISISPDMTLEELTTAVSGQDAVIAAFPVKDVNQHLRLAEAAFNAGVKRYIPADYGSCDASQPQPQKHLPLYRDKNAVQQKCAQLAASAPEGPFTWTAIVCGHFFDWAVRHNHIGMDLATRTALIFDDGARKASYSTMRQVARAIVAVLQKPDETANRFVHMQSFNVTQLEILAAFERATGASWHKQFVDSNAYLTREGEKFDAGDKTAMDKIVYALGAVDSDWTTRSTFAMDLLGLKEENMDVILSGILAEQSA